MTFLTALTAGYALLLFVMVGAFVLPLFTGGDNPIGFQILWIFVLMAAILAVFTLLLLLRKPWHMKKVVYGVLVFFILAMGGAVLKFAKGRLTSVSFRLFTWISTWEMIRTSPVIGNGVGTFKVIYPAYRRPQIIVLEGKSNTETDHSEDEYVEVWQDEGIVGFGIMLWMILTAITFGLKQLRWYSRLHVPDAGRKRKILEIEADPRSYEVLGYLGAYCGALIHWTVDVSIRFVSSGVFSGLLPAVLVAMARNHSNPLHHEVRLSYDRWIRAGVAILWTGIFLWLGMELVPQSLIQGGDTTTGQIRLWAIMAGALLWIFIEVMELGIKTEKDVPFSEQYGPVNPRGFMIRVGAAGAVAVACAFGVSEFGRHFMADVHHNLAIFFSKEGIWTKSPTYDGRISNFPPDIREKYRETGGALEHYQQVNKKNHAYPMAYYFTGNVYNDWGSQVNSDSLGAKNKGNMEEAERLRAKAVDMWDKAEAAYSSTKKLAPNYVQTHHQMALLEMKRAEMEAAWGQMDRAKTHYEKAEHYLRLYKMIDPVFMPNYDRLVQILMMQRKYQEATELYKEALFYNDEVAKSIYRGGFPDRAATLNISLAKTYYSYAVNAAPNPFNPLHPAVREAVAYFERATKIQPSNNAPDLKAQWVEAWKGLGFLYDKMGRSADAQKAWQSAHALAPNDPDLKVSAPLR